MAEESFLLVNLREGKSRELANVISNETSRLILNFLSKKEATETEMAKEMKLPISTVHYNLQNLLKAGLVKVEEFHYSKKGKEVNHYKLSNKFIIIVPEVTETIKEKLRKILPIGLLAVAATGVIQLLVSASKLGLFSKQAEPVLAESAKEEAVMLAKAPAAQATAQAPNIALWFLFGALFVIVVYLIIGSFRKRQGN